MTTGAAPSQPLALVYLARGADVDHLSRFRKFLQSYSRYDAGVDHRLVIIFKGFEGQTDLSEGQRIFRSLNYDPVFTDDDSFDIGAYIEAARQIHQERVCFLNTNSEIACDGWLAKLSANLEIARVGLVGATGSFESLPSFPDFPNPHIRTNGFMIRRALFLELLSNVQLSTKWDAYSVESGGASITRQVLERGLTALVVGRDGRGYAPNWWPHSQTFRQGSQHNLLVHDNVTRTFESLPFGEKIHMSKLSWGEFLQTDKHL
ncbi:hypothetical protein [Bradyrhizobium sp. Ai1a-2]|uniref:hypothetical protein n=1 Tax=Bradyrhizobium sp. Ai1a-2 TaxID=196490 RepID=UPI00048531DD|nr:hypothetical protein [Bradyrhizobium sp. Ai1a-2]